jgi:hypothetical protein
MYFLKRQESNTAIVTESKMGSHYNWLPTCNLCRPDQRSCSMASRESSASKNAITIDHLSLACHHVEEMMAAGITENMAIRTLELFIDVYANLHMGGSATPHHVDQVELWSIKARKLRDALPDAKPRDYFRVEHGTPQRGFARKVLELYRKGKLAARTMDKLVERDYKLAVITLDEDKILNKIARSKMFDTPEERWASAGIRF